MQYFGGGGVKGRLHSSLRSYIDCFLSPPFPKAFPRGGGIYQQDPILMRDFRTIRKFEIDWKDAQRQIEEGKKNLGSAQPATPGMGGGFNLEDLVDALAEES